MAQRRQFRCAVLSNTRNYATSLFKVWYLVSKRRLYHAYYGERQAKTL